MNAEAIFFDLDGTLADTAPDLAAAANRLRTEEGLPPLPLASLRPHTSSGVRGMLRTAFDMAPEHPDYPAFAQRFLDHYQAALCVHSRLFDQMDTVLHTLESADIKWGIVTNKRSAYTLPLIEALGLHTRASCIISGDSAPKPKPAPDTLLKACIDARVDPLRCLYVGDDYRDIVAGRAAGMGTAAAAWGYLGVDLPIDQWQADHIIQQPMELLALIGL